MSASRKGNFVTIAVAAFILGLAFCPYAYIAIGALRGLNNTALLGVLVPLIFSSGFLLWRYVPKPANPPKSNLDMMAILLIAMEVMSWSVLLAFFYHFMSALDLPTEFERVRITERMATFVLLFLCSSALCLPVVLMRDTRLERRLMRLPMDLSLAALVIILSVAGAVIVADIVVSFRFFDHPIYWHIPG